MEKYPIEKVMEQRKSLRRGTKEVPEEDTPPRDKPRIKTPRHSLPQSQSQSKEDKMSTTNMSEMPDFNA